MPFSSLGKHGVLLIAGMTKLTERYSPALPEIGHSLIQDDTFEGYHFPKGTVVTWNMWSICTDPKEYEQPERFWPERFLDEDLDKPFKGHLGFGAGMLSISSQAHPGTRQYLLVSA